MVSQEFINYVAIGVFHETFFYAVTVFRFKNNSIKEIAPTTQT